MSRAELKTEPWSEQVGEPPDGTLEMTCLNTSGFEPASGTASLKFSERHERVDCQKMRSEPPVGEQDTDTHLESYQADGLTEFSDKTCGRHSEIRGAELREPGTRGRDSVEFLETRGREPIPLENGISMASTAGKRGAIVVHSCESARLVSSAKISECDTATVVLHCSPDSDILALLLSLSFSLSFHKAP